MNTILVNGNHVRQGSTHGERSGVMGIPVHAFRHSDFAEK